MEQLIAEHPQHVNTVGGRYGTTAVTAVAGRHLELAQVLYRNSSSVNPWGDSGWTLLGSAGKLWGSRNGSSITRLRGGGRWI